MSDAISAAKSANRLATKPKSSFKLDDNISSPQDLRAVISEIREYARWFSHNAIMQRLSVTSSTKTAPSKSGKASKFEQPVLTTAAAALISGHIAVTTQKNLDSLIKDLQAYETKAARISITLAAPPAGGLKRTLVAWCRQNIAPDTLVTFSFNSTLLGGMVVRSGSHIFDWSFRRQILAGRAEFPKHLRGDLHETKAERHV